jgi:hypothetical protein
MYRNVMIRKGAFFEHPRSFRDETYGDIKKLGYTLRGRIAQGRNIRGRITRGRIIMVPANHQPHKDLDNIKNRWI